VKPIMTEPEHGQESRGYVSETSGHLHGTPESDHAEAYIHPHVEPLVKELRYRIRELIPVAACVAGGIIILVLATGIHQSVGGELGPTFWPNMLGSGLVGFGVLLVFLNVMRGIRASDIPERLTRWGLGRLAVTGVILVGYLLLWNVLQFWLITLVALVALTALFGARSWKALIIFPTVVAAVLHVLFVVALRVPL
jgi:hypothetical protein